MILIFLIALILGNITVINSRDLTAEKTGLIRDGQTLLLNGQWDNAYALFVRYHRNDTTDPAGYLYRAAALHAEMMDREENMYGVKFEWLCDSTRLWAQRELKSCTARDSALYRLYVGHQYAYRALWESRFGSDLASLNFGIKARNQYLKGIEIDSTLYDIYLGLGNYHYWKSVKSGILKFAGIFKNEKKAGIREIMLAADSSLFSSDASKSALIWIMINEKDYDSAIALCGELREKYPNGNSFVWPMAEAFYKSGQYDKAAENYDFLLSRFKKEPGNYYNLIEAAYWLSLSYEKMGQNKKALGTVNYLRKVYKEIPPIVKRREKSKLAYLMNRYSRSSEKASP